jgi:hypothetical protein
MHKEVALAQSSTILEWADVWERDASMENSEGYASVAFYLFKAATAMQRVWDKDAPEINGVTVLPNPEATVDTKDG